MGDAHVRRLEISTPGDVLVVLANIQDGPVSQD